MTRRDPHQVLGVRRGASRGEIKRAFRDLARRHHPDVSRDPGAAERFKEIVAAYEQLGSDHAAAADASGGSRRAADEMYRDWARTLEEVLRAMSSARPAGWGAYAPSAPPRPARGADLRATVEIDLAEAAAGGPRRLTFSAHVSCPACDGRRGPSGARCPACAGRGTRAERRTVEIRLPIGVRDGQIVRATGAGLPGLAGPGDLVVVVKVRPRAGLERRGDDLLTSATLPFALAALGGTTSVIGLDGSVELLVPAGTQAGAILRAPGRGMPRADGTRGDLLVRVTVAVPTELSPRQRELLRELAQS
jgi:molecular chaperone DnaJ